MQKGPLAGLISVILNTLLFAIKIWAGVISGSVALIADAWHTLSDSLSSVILIIGFRISSQPADKDHPFGHGRAEIISTLIIGMLLAIIGFNFSVESVKKFISHEEASYGKIAIIVTIISVVVKELMAQYSFSIAKQINSNSLKADGWHHRSDAFSSIIILAGIFLADYFWWIDSLLGMAVSILIFILSFRIMKETIDPLLGEKPDRQIIQQITDLSEKHFDFSICPHHFHIHKYGDHTEMTFHIVLPDNMTIREYHDIVENFESDIRTTLGIYPTIHVDSAKVKSRDKRK